MTPAKPTPKAKSKLVTPEELQQLEHEIEYARKRLGTPKDTLQWFLNFAETDLQELPPTQRAAESYNLFAAARATKDSWPLGKSPEPLSLTNLRKAQREIKEALQLLFSDIGVWVPPGHVKVGYQRTSPKEAKEPSFGLDVRIFGIVGFALTGFGFALQTAGKFLRQCKRCDKFFVATKRQEYCSTDCSQIVRNDKKKRIKEEKKVKAKKK